MVGVWGEVGREVSGVRRSMRRKGDDSKGPSLTPFLFSGGDGCRDSVDQRLE